MENYPIYIDGEAIGELRVERRGVRTIFDAACKPRPELLRISVYGESPDETGTGYPAQEGYLGVLAPDSGELRLHRVLSRSDMRQFPPDIHYVGRAGAGINTGTTGHADSKSGTTAAGSDAVQQGQTYAKPEHTGPGQRESGHMEAMSNAQAQAETWRQAEEQGQAQPAQPGKADETDTEQPAPDQDIHTQPPVPSRQAQQDAAPAPDACTELVWYSSPDGVLVSFDGSRTLAAFPAEDIRIPKNAVGIPRVIDGKDYLVFPTDNGKVSWN